MAGRIPTPLEGPPIPGARWPWAKPAPVVEMQETALFEVPAEIATKLGLPKGIPHVEYGRVSIGRKGWHRVSFKTPFVSTPIVVPTGEYREKWYSPPKYEAAAKKIEIPATGITKKAVAIPSAWTRGNTLLGVPVRSWEIPRYHFSRGEMQNRCRDAMYKAVHDFMVAPGGLPYWLDEPMAYIGGLIGYAAGYFFWYFYEYIVQVQFDRARDTINTALRYQTKDINAAQTHLRAQVNDQSDFVINGVNRCFKEIAEQTSTAFSELSLWHTSQVNAALDRLAHSIEVGINESNAYNASQVEDAVNTAIAKLYESMGMEKGQAMTPMLYRGVTETSFEIYSLGDMVVDYLAIETIPTPEIPR